MFANTNLFRIFKANIFTSHVKSQNKSIFDVKRIAMSLTMNLGVFHEKKKNESMLEIVFAQVLLNRWLAEFTSRLTFKLKTYAPSIPV